MGNVIWTFAKVDLLRGVPVNLRRAEGFTLRMEKMTDMPRYRSSRSQIILRVSTNCSLAAIIFLWVKSADKLLGAVSGATVFTCYLTTSEISLLPFKSLDWAVGAFSQA